MKFIPCLLFFIAPFINAMGRGDSPIDTALIDSKIEHVMSSISAVGLSVVVVKEDSIFFTRTYGYKDNGYRGRTSVKMLESYDLFKIASVSKTFTATAIMQLVENNLVELDGDINDYLYFPVRNPHFPDVPITIRMLLSHHSSITDKGKYTNFDVVNQDKGSLNQSFTDVEPGGEYLYSNLNYNLLGAVVETVSRERFDDYIDQHISKKIGIEGGFYSDILERKKFVTNYFCREADDSLVHVSVTYKPLKGKLSNYKLGYSTPIFFPAGGMVISAEDLAHFMIMHINDGAYNGYQIITSESEHLMRTLSDNYSNCGLGLRKYGGLKKGEVLFGHTGYLYGLFSSMIFNPEKKYGFVIICNGCKVKYEQGYEKLHLPLMRILFDYIISN